MHSRFGWFGILLYLIAIVVYEAYTRMNIWDGTMRIERQGPSDDVCVWEAIPVRQLFGNVIDRRPQGSIATSQSDVHTHTDGEHLRIGTNTCRATPQSCRRRVQAR